MERELELSNELEVEEKVNLNSEQKLLNVVYNKANLLANEGKKLRVYFDVTNNKYFIDVFAASSLNIISFDVAKDLINRGFNLYEISKNILTMLENIFKNNIEYHHINEKKVNTNITEPGFNGEEINYNENKFNYKDNNIFNDSTHILNGNYNKFTKNETGFYKSGENLDFFGDSFNRSSNKNYNPKAR